MGCETPWAVNVKTPDGTKWDSVFQGDALEILAVRVWSRQAGREECRRVLREARTQKRL
jgi:hypothetical protein